MSDELLPYYNSELAFLRSLGSEFAQAHPKIASRLRLSAEGSQDPHVERLVQAFAYLNARTRHKLDDDFPEITDALLGVLYPHYQAPTPSLAVVEFLLDRSQGELTGGYAIEKGSRIETEPVEGERCLFRTCYPVTLWPFQLQSATVSGRPFQAPQTPRSPQAAAVLRLELATFSQAVRFSQLKLSSLRFFLHAARAQNVYALYELIFNHTLQVALASSARDDEAAVLAPTCLKPVGFERDEGLFPYGARSFLGYRLLSEYFALPEKFLFFDLAGLNPERLARIGNKLEIYFYLDRESSPLERTVSQEMFRLGSTPMINLFPERADPFELTGTQTEYRVVPDARRPLATEIYSVDRVAATSPAGEEVEYQPFYSLKHGAGRSAQQTFWYATRRPAGPGRAGPERDQGAEVYLSFVDLDFSPTAPAEWTIHVEATCLNRDLPRRLPFGGGRPRLALADGQGPVSAVVCLTPPTATLRPARKHGALWRLISHLSLNHLSIADSPEGVDALREILKLYDVADSSQTRAMIDGILRLGGRRVVGRAGGVAGGFCRGVEVAIHLDEEKFTGSGAYLFACVLDRFLGLYSSINSFSRLVVTSAQRDPEGEPWRWPPRAGEKVLL